MMLLIYILRKYTGGNKITTSQEKIIQQMYIADIKLIAKNEKKNWKT